MSSHWRRKERRRLAQLEELSKQGMPNILRQAGVLHQQLEGKFFSGPIPPPDQLEHYDRVQAGLAERIVAMAEKQYAMAESQTKHRQDLEKSVIRHNIVLSYLGWGSGFVLGSGGLVIASYLIYLGKELGGGAAFVGSLAALVGLFFYGKRKQTEELSRKRPPRPVITALAL